MRHLASLEKLPPDELRAQRQAKIASFGVFSETGVIARLRRART